MASYTVVYDDVAYLEFKIIQSFLRDDITLFASQELHKCVMFLS